MVKNISYTFLSNLFSAFISAIVTFIVPKFLGVENYGYFQLYLFYVPYVGFLHFGWADGIFLRYGGDYYDKLDRSKFSAQFWLYSSMEIVFGITIMLVGSIFVQPSEKALVVALVGASAFLYLPRTLLQYILQCTNRVKVYSMLTVIEKIIYATVIVIALLNGRRSYLPMIVADLIGKTCALIYAVIQCADIVFSRPEPLGPAVKEARANISVGIKLMFANVASSLIIGVVRIAIENQWDIATFGKVSLTMTVSSLLMIFINAVALVLFPMLRRISMERLTEMYGMVRTCLMLPMMGMLVLYYPIKVILSAWLPEYQESLIYMAILFPMCVFESKMSMLVGTYMKALRKERWLLNVNVLTVGISILLTGVTVFLKHNLDFAIFSIILLLAFRCVLAELLISRELKIQVKFDIMLELFLTVVFISSSWLIRGIAGLVIYAGAYTGYLIIKRKDLCSLAQATRKRVRK